jgi:hypothetical protein
VICSEIPTHAVCAEGALWIAKIAGIAKFKIENQKLQHGGKEGTEELSGVFITVITDHHS